MSSLTRRLKQPSSDQHPSWRLGPDHRIAFAVVAAYVVLALIYEARAQWWVTIGAALVYVAIITALGRSVPRGKMSAISLVVVAAGGGVFTMGPVGGALGKEHYAPAAVGWLGVHAVALVWVSVRWKPAPKERVPITIREAWTMGVFGAAALSVLATLGVVARLAAGQRSVLWVYPAYFCAGLLGSTAYWAMQSWRHLGVGRYLIGVVIGICTYGACMPVAALFIKERMSVAEMVWFPVILGTLMGPIMAMLD